MTTTRLEDTQRLAADIFAQRVQQGEWIATSYQYTAQKSIDAAVGFMQEWKRQERKVEFKIQETPK